jgi:hypothetical protein
MAMFMRFRIIVSVAAILASSSGILAKGGGLPNVDIQKLCRAVDSATDETVRNTTPKSSDGSCAKSEQAAREQLIHNWAIIPASDKASCVQPMVYRPSYFEWLACIEMSKNVRNARKEKPALLLRSKSCPWVKWDGDGTIASAIACDASRKRL